MLVLVQVKVTKGFFGERGEDSVIPVDEIYNLYFVKKAKVITDKYGGMKFAVK